MVWALPRLGGWSQAGEVPISTSICVLASCVAGPALAAVVQLCWAGPEVVLDAAPPSEGGA
eukprot:10538829-Prorocentrum_lima.AAC.1